MARFARSERSPRIPNGPPDTPTWLVFLWEVNTVRPGTFDCPDSKPDTPGEGYYTETYPHARVIHAPGDEGVRVVADSPDVVPAFRIAAARLGIHLGGSV